MDKEGVFAMFFMRRQPTVASPIEDAQKAAVNVAKFLEKDNVRKVILVTAQVAAVVYIGSKFLSMMGDDTRKGIWDRL